MESNQLPSNENFQLQEHPKLEVQRAWLYQPRVEWTYAHHPFITHFEGQYIAMWSCGLRDEDAVGQRILIATSPDGMVWSDALVLASPPDDHILTAAGFYHGSQGLVAYFSAYDDEHRRTRLLAKLTRDGKNWTPEVDLKCPISPNQAPYRDQTGRIHIAVNYAIPHTDQDSGLGPWRWSTFAPNSPVEDNTVSFWEVRDRDHLQMDVCEGCVLEREDALLLMLRGTGVDATGNLWASWSKDQGQTWTKPVHTDFSDNDAKFQFGRLEDGRSFYVGNPDRMGKRNPLVFSLSSDGIHFNRHYIIGHEPYRMNWPGKLKSGDYGYPNVCVVGNKVSVIVSRQKENIEVLHFELPK